MLQHSHMPRVQSRGNIDSSRARAPCQVPVNAVIFWFDFWKFLQSRDPCFRASKLQITKFKITTNSLAALLFFGHGCSTNPCLVDH
jgi:hypothetical protein